MKANEVWIDEWLFIESVVKPQQGDGMAGSHGFRRPVMGMAVSVLATFANIFPEQAGIIPVESKKVRRERLGGKASLYIGGGNQTPHQGKQECARRRRQAAAGADTPDYVHGAQYRV